MSCVPQFCMEDLAKQCADLIEKSQFISVLTGAGISTKAGIPDFRGPKGLYITRQYDPDIIFDINYFYQDQKPFYQFARDFLHLEEKIKPTFTHQFLNQLEQSGKCKAVITQNIDSLHQLAGSKKVFEMHGSFWTSYCLDCPKFFSFSEMKKLIKEQDVPQCECGGVIKPDIVFFGENVKFFNEASLLASKADLFFVIGTSCVVYPAAMIPGFVKGDVIIVNQGPVELKSDRVIFQVNEDSDGFFMKVSQYLSTQGK